MTRHHRWIGRAVVAMVSGAVTLMLRYAYGHRRQEAAWHAAARRVGPLDLGSVEELRLVPLVDAEAARGLSAQHGVSYLVVADGRSILFDLGLSASTLECNAHELGVALGAVDMIVVSHGHPDHCGGAAAWLRRGFDLPDHVKEGIRVWTPTPMHHRDAQCMSGSEPAVLAAGVATTGTIARQLFLLGWTPEQALIVNVRGKGLVVIVGCGHQGLRRLLLRVRALTEEPVHAVVGGFHLPVHGLYAQEFVGSARWPWRRTTETDVADAIDVLRGYQPRLVAPSPHDSSAWTLGRFAAAFPAEYRRLRVGDEIVISSGSA